jgi:hypothetical protein
MNGYSIPKMHGVTKIQSYIKLFESGMNFYGGPGEASHKTFVKSAGQKHKDGSENSLNKLHTNTIT